MQTFHGPDGRVDIPDTRPGEIVTIQVAREVEARDEGTGPIPEEDREEIKKQVLQLAHEICEGLTEPWLSADLGDLLYGDDGMPRWRDTCAFIASLNASQECTNGAVKAAPFPSKRGEVG